MEVNGDQQLKVNYPFNYGGYSHQVTKEYKLWHSIITNKLTTIVSQAKFEASNSWSTIKITP